MTSVRVQIRSSLLLQAVTAALLGAVFGVSTGIWASHYLAAADAARSASVPTALISPTGKTASPAVGRVSTPVGFTGSAAAPVPPPSATVKPAPRIVEPVGKTVGSAGVASGDLLERARALAQRSDVMGLLVMREELVARAAERGETEAPATKYQLAELDRDLADARVLQLKKDALEFRRLPSKPDTRQ